MLGIWERKQCDMDYNESWVANESKFSSITSFTASVKSVQRLRDYILDTLEHAGAREVVEKHRESILPVLILLQFITATTNGSNRK